MSSGAGSKKGSRRPKDKDKGPPPGEAKRNSPEKAASKKNLKVKKAKDGPSKNKKETNEFPVAVRFRNITKIFNGGPGRPKLLKVQKNKSEYKPGRPRIVRNGGPGRPPQLQQPKNSMASNEFSDPTESLCNQFEAVNLSAPQMRRPARSVVPRESEFKEDWPYSSFPSVPLNSFVTPAAIANTSSALTVKENAPVHIADKDTGWDVDFASPSLNDSKEDDTIFTPLSFLSGERILPSRLVAEHLVVGSFDTAQHLLCDQLGVIHFELFKQLFMDVQERNEAIHLEELTRQLQTCYGLTTEGQFAEAITRFRQLLLSVPLLVVDSKQKVAEAQQLIEICRKYLVGLLLEQKRRELPSNTEEEKLRVLELAAYFTHCDLQPSHTILTLRSAAKLSYNLKQYRMCYIFAQRCLDLGPEPDVAQQMRKAQAACGNAPSDAHPINYDSRNSFNVCSRTFVPLYQGKPQTKCPFCGASFDPKFNGQVCDVCQVAEIGRDVTGLCISTFDTEC